MKTKDNFTKTILDGITYYTKPFLEMDYTHKTPISSRILYITPKLERILGNYRMKGFMLN